VVERHLPDTCIDIDEGLGLSFMSTAMCKNGTNAMIAGFKGKDCDPTNKPLDDPFTVWHPAMSGFFVPTDEINSMSFWCDGLPGVDMRKPNRKAANGPNLGLILGITIPVSVTFLLVMGFAVAYSINYHFRMKVKVSIPHWHIPDTARTDMLDRNSLVLVTGTLRCEGRALSGVVE
jgi:hypothetical protein